MPFNDLRSFIEMLKKKDEIIEVHAEVDSRYEIGALCRKALWDGGVDQNKALFFENVKGFSIPIAANILDSTRRYYMGLELPPDLQRGSFPDIWEKKISSPVEPKIVAKAPCKENIVIGNEVDLLKFPVPIWNEKDGGRFITMPVVISRDIYSGKLNSGIYRSQVFDRDKLGLLVAPYRHMMIGLGQVKPGDKVPVALVMGLDPSIYIAAAAPVGYGTDEIEIAGALRGSPVDMIRCETIPLEVPAYSEIVIEAEMTVGETMPEGPFGEFTGYYGEAGNRPFARVKAITYRNNPIFQACYEGAPNTADSVLQILGHEAELKRKLQPEHKPWVKAISIPDFGSIFFAVASISKQYDGQAKAIGHAIMSTYPTARWIKLLILVDDDINPFDIRQVLWALVTRSNFDQDLDIMRYMTGTLLDPAMALSEKENKTGRHCKIMIDATKPLRLNPLKPMAEEVMPKKEVWDKVEELWAEKVAHSSKTNFPLHMQQNIHSSISTK